MPGWPASCVPVPLAIESQLTIVLHDVSRASAGDFYSGPDSGKASVRDIYGKKDLGNYTNTFTAAVPPMDALLLRFGFQ
jgi:hypothetical protein